MENRLHIYRSSAGSGKTFTLVKEYLRIVLARPEEYRHVLAITFTNKAAEEMKNRVIEALVDLESGNGSSLR
ncbi:MAG: UvrD-helicase domain-containing protein, partial [Flavobacteriales bacterium]